MIPLTVLIVPTIAAPIQNLNKKPLKDIPYLKGLKLAHPVTSTEQFTINLLLEQTIIGMKWSTTSSRAMVLQQYDQS